MRRDDVASTSVRRHFDAMCPLGNVCFNVALGYIGKLFVAEIFNHFKSSTFKDFILQKQNHQMTPGVFKAFLNRTMPSLR